MVTSEGSAKGEGNAQPRLRPVELILLLDPLLHSKLRKQGCHASGSSSGDDGQQCAKCEARRTQTKPPGDPAARAGIRTASLFPFIDTCPIANQQNVKFLRPALF